jgi:hypothetical protein
MADIFEKYVIHISVHAPDVLTGDVVFLITSGTIVSLQFQ